MAVTTAVRLRRTRSAAERWSLAAFLLAALGIVASAWFIVASPTDTEQVRWWLVVAPLIVAAIPLVVPRPGVRVAATLALGAWCWVAMFSIGMLQLPALVAAFGAVLKDRR